ncbi:MAG: SPJ_0845 family protein [Enterococcus italicus]
MGLKFQYDDTLDRRFDDFAILPDELTKTKKDEVDIERFLKTKDDDKEQKEEK